ncbi:hypothetical protein M406DRAFT_325164 [Cryphonectria parasitica EP155]|uniref:Uncharacterized protein n=1 Tax=Cryphonectria parasitica (strain ATCC 38755 / EP155) TaxID=660469 RepID=A0A9P5CTQ1_CRYP1|nr:uncharacterized protein M406DRAFT_325164 [Cryphonectria parasitica EP155]KAF3769671.1 hypothetical protein M406DRAFT_325164 [Cryphonectria parasitica EP155]
MSMFKRANATYEAKNSGGGSSRSSSNSTHIHKAAPPHVSLAKQLFPSSSPSQIQHVDIRDQLQKRPGPSFGRSRPSQSSEPVQPPLRPRSSNSSQPDQQHLQSINHSAGSKQFASLYRNNENSFKQEPDLVDLTADEDVKVSKTKKSVANVEFFDDDFSSDEDLDLDYQCPSTLPAPLPRVASSRTGTDVPADNASTVSWSQSSPSHYQAAQSISQSTASQASSKRSAPENGLRAAQPIAKKRFLPKEYQEYGKAREGLVPASVSPAIQPTSKKGPLAFDMTPEDVRAQQKRLKDKTKKAIPNTTETPPELPAEEIQQQPVTSHTVKQSAIALSNEQEVVKELVSFAHMLNEMRLGRISDDTVRAFKALARPLQLKDGLEVTELPQAKKKPSYMDDLDDDEEAMASYA